MEIEKLDSLDLQHWINNTEFTYASHYGNGHNKKLVATLDGHFKVYHHGEVVTNTTEYLTALTKYNSL